MIMRRLSNALAIILGAVLSAPNIVAQDLADGWIIAPFSIDYDQRGSAIGDYNISGWRLDPQDRSVPHIRFNCSERAGLVAIVSPTPEKQSDIGRRFKPRLAKTRLNIEGRKKTVVSWLHIRETGIMQTRQNQTAKQIFNAVITGAQVNVNLPMGGGKASFSPPPVDDAFKQFIKSCDLG